MRWSTRKEATSAQMLVGGVRCSGDGEEGVAGQPRRAEITALLTCEVSHCKTVHVTRVFKGRPDLAKVIFCSPHAHAHACPERG